MIGYDIFDKLKARYKVGEKFRILFCPYKEDMFDSMATIFEKACMDEETITDVMPIPYFTLVNALPSTTEMEFKLFQDNFPTILNETWDVIVIHYPYDTINNVTRPFMTSAMLKFFCTHLVHINYAVIGDRDIDPTEARFPAYKNCDLIICEREKHKEQLSKYLQDNHINTECVAWSSPKFDKLDIKYPMPHSWEQAVKDRKVILLQTSLIPFLKNPYKLKQIENILDRYMNDDSVCLWWRPHPLLRASIKAHRPSMLEKYDELVKKVEESRHILDDTKELHRAIAMTDEMISDRSSVVVMYEYTGKPVTLLE